MTITLAPAWPVDVPVVIVVGFVYAHLAELQHECLHEHAYNHRWLNRLVGFACGLPMMSSFWHYKYDHLRHHAYLGTPQNREFFNYRFHDLDSVPGFLRGCFHLGRYKDVGINIGRSLLGQLNPQVNKTVAAKKIRTEYIAFAVVLGGAVAASVATGSLILLVTWAAPALLVAEPTHFLIELPEHFGLNSQTDPNVLTNTRTVRASRLARWFTNGNDLHTAHHFHQGVPMARIPELHVLIEGRISMLEPSYWSFYRKVINGELTYQDLANTCMTRWYLLFSLPAGAMADRWNQRGLMITCDVIRMLLLVTVPALALPGILTLPYLYAVVGVSGVLTVLFTVAARAQLPRLISSAHLIEGNGTLGMGESLGEMVGPSISGVLIGLAGAARTVFLNVATYAISALALGLIRVPASAEGPRSRASVRRWGLR